MITANRDEAAIRAKDVDGVLRPLAQNVVIFDLAPPLKSTGADRKGMKAWFDTWSSPIDYEVTDLHITVSNDLAFARSINRIGGTKIGGALTSIWVRVTVCFQKIDGEWKVVHDHSSVPMLMDGSAKAATDLKP